MKYALFSIAYIMLGLIASVIDRIVDRKNASDRWFVFACWPLFLVLTVAVALWWMVDKVATTLAKPFIKP